jgi:hypothetical protein
VSTVATSLSGNEQEAVQRNQATYELYVEWRKRYTHILAVEWGIWYTRGPTAKALKVHRDGSRQLDMHTTRFQSISFVVGSIDWSRLISDNDIVSLVTPILIDPKRNLWELAWRWRKEDEYKPTVQGPSFASVLLRLKKREWMI